MGFRYRRSVKLLPGVRMNFSKSGIGMSFGVPGARISFGPTGRVTRTVGIPGTGMSWVSSTSARSHRTSSPAATTPAPPRPPSPGLFASADERTVIRAFKAKDVPTLTAVAGSEGKSATLAAFYAALILSDRDDEATALTVFEPAWQHTPDIDRDQLFAKYAHSMTVTVQLCDAAQAQAPGSRDTAGLLYAELLQAAGRTAEALAVVRQLTWGPAVAISAADLMTALGDWDGVISVTENMPTGDDGGALLWVFRARAYRMKGLLDAAEECLKPGCSSRVRDASVRAEALVERAELRMAQGHSPEAKRDVERVLATDSTNPVALAFLNRIVRNEKDEVDSH